MVTKLCALFTIIALVVVACHDEDKPGSEVGERLQGFWTVADAGTSVSVDAATVGDGGMIVHFDPSTVEGATLRCNGGCRWRRESKELISIDHDAGTETYQDQLEDGDVTLHFRDPSGLQQLHLKRVGSDQ